MKNQLIDDYLTALASQSSTPGGGAVAAVTGAQAAALIAMVCAFSQSSDPALKTLITEINERAKQAKTQFIELGDADIIAFKEVMLAYKLAKKTDLEKQQQQEAMQKALYAAALAPLQTLNLAQSLAKDVEALAEIGNKNLITDIGIAAILLPATIRSAEMNVMINLRNMTNEEFKQSARSQIKTAHSIIQPMDKLADSINNSLANVRSAD